MKERDGVLVLFERIMAGWSFTDDEANEVLRPILDPVLRIATDLDALYRDDEVVKKFLRARQVALEGQTPAAMLVSGDLTKLEKLEEYVAYLSGR